MDKLNGKAGSHQTNLHEGEMEMSRLDQADKRKTKQSDTHLSGNMRRPLSMPGVYDRTAANIVSNTRPKLSAQFLMPWWKIELRRVLQMIKSAHWTTTMDTKNAVWQVNSSVLRSR